jgi:hypothetical protein
VRSFGGFLEALVGGRLLLERPDACLADLLLVDLQFLAVHLDLDLDGRCRIVCLRRCVGLRFRCRRGLGLCLFRALDMRGLVLVGKPCPLLDRYVFRALRIVGGRLLCRRERSHVFRGSPAFLQLVRKNLGAVLDDVGKRCTTHVLHALSGSGHIDLQE